MPSDGIRGDGDITLVAVATGNRGKLAEIQAAVSLPDYRFIAVTDLGEWEPPVEDGDTFEANARIKALAAHRKFGLPALADDSGLEVDALDGAPGVISSHYAGDEASDADNNALLLARLADVPLEHRTARFRCVMVCVGLDERELVATGVCEGRVLESPRGSGGFGYDPLFEPDAAPGRTMAELDLGEKNAISHRGGALRAMRALLR